MFIAVLCASHSASASRFLSDGLIYHILSEEDRRVEVTYYTYDYSSGQAYENKNYVSGDIEIPRKVIINSKTYTVTSIGFSAFWGCDGLTSVTIPNSVTFIGDEAFYGCSRLRSIMIPNSVTSIGDEAFDSCDNLTSVTIPNSVTSIGDNAFRFCRRLENINVDSGNTNYSSIDGILYNKDATSLIKCPTAKNNVKIPNSVISIEDYAFYYCGNLTSVTIPNSVTSIGGHALRGCDNLTSVTVPNSVTSIGDYAFSYCSGLTSVTIPNSVTSIGDYAFSYCSNLTSMTIPNSVTSIGNYAFDSCDNLTSVTIPNSVTSIGSYAFGNCNSLTSVTIPNSVTSIGYGAFWQCARLTSVTIPNSVTSIGDKAFWNCYRLTSVTIPNSVTSIGDYAFDSCDNLEAIYMQCEVPIKCSPGFDDKILKKTILYVPTGKMTEYEKVDPWRNFWNIEEMDFSGVVDGIDEAEEYGALHISVNNGVLTIDGIDSQEGVTVYDVQGHIFYNGISHTIDKLPSGLYIVTAGSRTIKISI